MSNGDKNYNSHLLGYKGHEIKNDLAGGPGALMLNFDEEGGTCNQGHVIKFFSNNA